MFYTIGFLVGKILNIDGSQIEIEKIFFCMNTYYYKEMSFAIE
jgi:hypothetical protein